MKVVVVGGVAGGASFAARLRRLTETARITIFEKGPYVSFANCGLPYYIGGRIEDREELLLADPTLFRQRFNIDARPGHEVLKIDRKTKSVLVKDLQANQTFQEPYDYLVLSPGALPFKPQLPGVDLPGIFSLRNIPDSDMIKQWGQSHKRQSGRAVVVGGGFIGLEMAENLVDMGFKVTIVERSAQLMPPFDPEMMSNLHSYLRSEKQIDLKLQTSVSGFSQVPQSSSIQVNTDGGPIDADLVILAIGVRPDIALAKDCDIQLGTTGGIKVDDQMRTSDQSIYAVGDCVEVRDFVTGQPALIPLAGPANRQGRIAAASIAGRPVPFRGVQGTAVCKIFDLVVACTGASEKTLKRHKIPHSKVYLHPFQHAGYYPQPSRIAIKLTFDPKTGKLYGAQAVGKDGVEKRVDVFATAIQAGMTVYDLEEAELCYAPQVGSAKDAVNMAGMIAAASLRGDNPQVHWADNDFKMEGAQLVDVRSKGEYDKYHVDGSKLIPLPELRSRAATEIDKEKPVYLHCAVGQRGYYATRLLRNMGYNAFNYSGGAMTEQMVKASTLNKL